MLSSESPVLVVGSQQGRAVLAQPRQDPVFVQEVITSNQVASHQPSYIHKRHIQSPGNVVRSCVRDHVLVFACPVSQGFRGVEAIVNGAIMRPNAPYGTTGS
jgi:hypothetical protein